MGKIKVSQRSCGDGSHSSTTSGSGNLFQNTAVSLGSRVETFVDRPQAIPIDMGVVLRRSDV